MRSRVIERLQKSVINPLDKLAFALRTPPPGDALLETTGRRSGQPRVTPVCDCLERRTFWIVAQRGRDADSVKNIAAIPRVRVKAACRAPPGGPGRQRSSDDDDPKERARILDRATGGAGSACKRRPRSPRAR
jgi:deazaflavin-dependent oxidoreductase (nitroreductase family)